MNKKIKVLKNAMNYRYIYSGTLDFDTPAYVERKADKELYEKLKIGNYCYVFNSRKMGKSSLRVRVMNKLLQANYACCKLDFSLSDTTVNTAEKWYYWISEGIAEELELKLNHDWDFPAWWYQLNSLSPANKFQKFIDTIILNKIETSIVIFIDEIDSVFSFNFPTDDFFASIRGFYNRRADDKRYDRLVFCLLGVATPSILIEDKRRTPLNIGHAIALNGFTIEESQQLATGLQSKVDDPTLVLAKIWQWTKGQPFLTQKLLHLVVKSTESNPDIERLVEHKIINNWTGNDEPEFLRRIEKRLLYNKNITANLLAIYRRILERSNISVNDDSEEQMELRLSGLIVKHQGRLRVANPIYETVFDRLWIDCKLAALCPFQKQLTQWLASGRKETSRLIVGEALAEAKSWAEEYCFNEDEREFLIASEKLEREEQRKTELAEQTPILERELKVVEKSKKLIMAFTSLIFILFGVSSYFAYKPNPREIRALAQLSQAEYISERKLDALEKGIEAKEQLNKLENLDKITPLISETPKDLPEEVDSALQQAIYGVKEYDRLIGHEDHVYGVAVSADGNLVASVGEDLTIQLWKKDGMGLQQPKIVPSKHRERINDLAITPNGQTIVTASQDKTIKIWKKDGDGNYISSDSLVQEQESGKGHKEAVYAVAISADGRTIVSASEDKTIKIWQRGKLINTIAERGEKGHSNGVRAVAISADGRTVVSASEDKTIKIWNISNLENPQLTATLEGHTDGVRAVAISEDGRTIVSGSRDKTIKIWNISNLENSQLTATLEGNEGHNASINSVVFSPIDLYNPNQLNEEQIISGSNDGTIKIWDINLNCSKEQKPTLGRDISCVLKEPRATLKGHSDRIEDLAVFPRSVNEKGYTIASASRDKTVRLWKSKGDFMTILPDRQYPVIAVKQSQNYIVSAGDDGKIKIWDSQGNFLRSLKANNGQQVYNVAIDPQEKFVASGGADKTIKIWDFAGNICVDFPAHDANIWALAVSPDGQTLISADEVGKIKIWELNGALNNCPNPEKTSLAIEKNTKEISLETHIWDLAINPQGDRFLAAGKDGKIRIFDIQGKSIKPPLTKHKSAVRAVAYNSDGSWFVSGSEDGTIGLWNQDGSPIEFFQEDKSTTTGIAAIAISLDDTLIASASQTGEILIWQKLKPENQTESDAKWRVIQKLPKHNKPIWSLAFSPDGKTLTSSGEEPKLVLWNIEKIKRNELLDDGCELIKSYLYTNPEREESNRKLCSEK